MVHVCHELARINEVYIQNLGLEKVMNKKTQHRK